MAHGFSDTSRRAQAMQYAILRQLSPSRRGALALALSRTVLLASRRGIVLRYPQAAPHEVLAQAVRINYAVPALPLVAWSASMLADPLLAEAVQPVMALFERLQVVYHLGGSLASSLHGMPRATLGIDLVAQLEPAHIPVLVAELSPQFYCSETEMQEALAHEMMFPSFNLIHRTMGVKIDVFVPPPSPYLESRLARSVAIALDEQTPATIVRVATVEDMILTKLLWYEAGNRTSDRQWGDIVGMLAIQQATVDWEYLLAWAESLGVTGLLRLATDQAIDGAS
ncbi:conserved hypothetical protein (plasmid) [Herpetosiphon aurantiacus DSM 785]|uniref:Uncharacterized protein n=1 Tax=Herpetosiphon aurantiacus (strain ATCC 23779 / DSM 785 / 114-95) TaxID=316274 RepID=A9B8I2_HERA2|nr:conserved hypothetical protein [Herpetosiphon aurantiacus DSM 785]